MRATVGVPVLRGLPLLGNILEFRSRRLRLQTHAVTACGDLGWIGMGPLPPMLFVNSAEDAYTILVEQRDRFIKDRRFTTFSEPLVGKGLFTAEHDLHRRQRRLMAPAFSPRRLTTYAECMVALGERQLSRWENGTTIVVAAEVMQLTLAIVGKTLFDAD